MTEKLPSWLDVEKAINREIAWLKGVVLPYQKNRNLLNYSDDILYRLIAILIVSGEVKVTEYNYSNLRKISQVGNIIKMHGAEWHDNLIKYLATYFTEKGYSVDIKAPKLFYGFADLGVSERNGTTFFEIDTVNIFKLYINLFVMKEIKLVIITFNKIIVFEL